MNPKKGAQIQSEKLPSQTPEGTPVTPAAVQPSTPQDRENQTPSPPGVAAASGTAQAASAVHPSVKPQDETKPAAAQSPNASNPNSGSTSSHKCANCGAVSTPLWRRGLKGEIMCNACGLYVKSRNVSRPNTLNRAPNTRVAEDLSGSCPGGGQCNGMGGALACSKCPTFNNRAARAKQSPSNPNVLVSCQNCGTVTTPLWRRDNEGNTICNACGLYLRMHHEQRPVQMLKNTIKRRRRGDEEKSVPARHPPAAIDFNQEMPSPVQVPGMVMAMHSPGHSAASGPSPSLGPGPVPIAGPGPSPGQLPLPALPGAPPPGLYQPLSLLSYLSGDSKKEYLLAVRRQLQDKAAQCEAQLKQYIEHLRQCDAAIGESES